MVILHDEIKTIQNGVFVLFIIKEEKSAFFQKPKQTDLKKHVGWVYLKKTCFSQSWLSFNPFLALLDTGNLNLLILSTICSLVELL